MQVYSWNYQQHHISRNLKTESKGDLLPEKHKGNKKSQETMQPNQTFGPLPYCHLLSRVGNTNTAQAEMSALALDLNCPGN